MFSVLAALKISEFDVQAFESWLFLAVLFTWRESNKRRRKVSWYISQEIASGDYVLSGWSSGWLKFLGLPFANRFWCVARDEHKSRLHRYLIHIIV